MGVYSDQVIADGASNYWRLGETAGLTAVDVVGGKNGTISGGVTLNQPGALTDGDKAMLFDGFPGGAGKIITSAPVTLAAASTIEAWINPAAVSNDMPFVSNWGQVTAGNPTYCRISSPGVVEVFIAASQYSGGVVLSRGQWHHVAVVWDGLLKLYVDGVFDVSRAAVTNAATGPISIGHDVANSHYFKGGIDDVALYPRALTPAEISAHYTLGTTPVGVTIVNQRDLNTGLMAFLGG